MTGCRVPVGGDLGNAFRRPHAAMAAETGTGPTSRSAIMKWQLAFAFSVTLMSAGVIAAEHEHGDADVANAFIREIQSQNAAYVRLHKSTFFQQLAEGQHPRATVVTCSDSRVQTEVLDKTPEGDLFMVRNIGNQIATSLGSVEYGVNHLASSLLLIVGHSNCGAIKAASADYSSLEAGIRRELDTIKIDKAAPNIDGVRTNVNNQAAAAMQEFADKVKAGHLVIIGAVYDFSDDMNQGAGKLNIINVNGETDPHKIEQALFDKDAYCAMKAEEQRKKAQVNKPKKAHEGKAREKSSESHSRF
jgi:carbonic anhydrase